MAIFIFPKLSDIVVQAAPNSQHFVHPFTQHKMCDPLIQWGMKRGHIQTTSVLFSQELDELF